MNEAQAWAEYVADCHAGLDERAAWLRLCHLIGKPVAEDLADFEAHAAEWFGVEQSEAPA